MIVIVAAAGGTNREPFRFLQLLSELSEIKEYLRENEFTGIRQAYLKLKEKLKEEVRKRK